MKIDVKFIKRSKSELKDKKSPFKSQLKDGKWSILIQKVKIK